MNQHADRTTTALSVAESLVSVESLSKTFARSGGLFGRSIQLVQALDEVSLEIPRGKTFGLVGESGSGKSTLGRCLLRLEAADAGSVKWHEPDGRSVELTKLSSAELRRFRPRMQIIFQDPFHALNPSRPVWQIVAEGLIVNGSKNLRARAAEALKSVGLLPDHLDRLPHEFSGGQRQRIAMARALILEPEFIVCDEVTSALDTRTQARILELLREIQQRTGTTLLFISHDLHVVASMCDEVAVMRNGRIVEQGSGESLFLNPQTEYTKMLVDAVPNPNPRKRTFRNRTA